MKNKSISPNIIISIIILLCFETILCQGQIKVTWLDSGSVPKGIKYEGKIKDGLRWTDKSGDNIVIITETGFYTSQAKKDEDMVNRNAELFAYHFINKEDSLKQTWKVYDFIKDCPLDIEASFIKNTFQVTDLNKDGVAEVWLMYKTVCHGDISPCDMKIIMYQGQQKFAMRGQNKVKVSDTEFYGGNYKFDDAFNKGPEVFKEFAKKLWSKNIMQVWE